MADLMRSAQMNQEQFQRALACLRSKSSLLYDEGYHSLNRNLERTHLAAVVAAMKKEEDPEIRGRLIEVIGDSQEQSIVPVLKDELAHPSPEVRKWALHGLECVDTDTARKIIRAHIDDHPEDAP